MTEGARPRVPAILIGESTQTLLRDVFRRPDLLHGMHRIDRRIVAWGRQVDPVELPHRAAVISEEGLLAELGQVGEEGPPVEQSDWTIYASQPLPADFGEHAFGSRPASLTAVELTGSLGSACWIESLEEGWLFLVPDSPSTGWLIAVGGARDSLLAQSRLVADQMRLSGAESGVFRAYPRIADPLCAPGWLACGSAAMAFDPLCGDGTGAAIRESILASAVIRAVHAGDQADRLLAHYRARLTAGLLRHLEICRTFYASANCGRWWERELAALDEGIGWCVRALPAGGRFHYRLRGFELERIAL